MDTYVKKITPVKKDFLNTATEEDLAIMSEHFLYLQDKLEKGKLLIAGPCEDAAFGISIFYASSDEEAQEFLNNDPAVKKGVVTGEVHKYRISLFKYQKYEQQT